MLDGLDLTVIVVYLVGSAGLGLWLSGRQSNIKGYFLGNRELPWWAVTLSVVATETSALTVISTPAIAYLGNLSFLQVAIGYLLGRIVVAFVLLPKYYAGEMVTAYAYLGKRFGGAMQSTASVTFLLTRLLADGVRMYAAAIPLKFIMDGLGADVSYFWIITILSLVTVAYTYVGGIRAVVWVDVMQMGVYLAGGIVALAVLMDKTGGFWSDAADASKTQVFDFSSDIVTAPYAFVTAILGGALLSMASHGVDQIVVQRLLACRTRADAQKAVIASGLIVFVQFGLFMVVGLALWSYYDGRSLTDLGQAASGDELFPTFIVEDLPSGVAGLLLAGILAAAMSTLSSSLNALSSSTITDLVQRFRRTPLGDAEALSASRITTLVWGLVFIVFGNLFVGQDTPVLELGLSVASITYGGLLGAFFLGIFVRRASQLDAMIAFGVAVAVMASMFVYQQWIIEEGEVFIGFTWYTAIGVVITMVLGWLLSRLHPANERAEAEVPE
ncbi:sodium:solute symporter [Solicola gregarius]|uniref:Sodium:solute symporter n=1 Tax=Solicola gregarius TaxID=2908642 RepID=A0AA46TG32_9ACTN|nr:sodium:solute symporter [Solicola gregarius]UYM04600.1 sodium:solute symporter [Solicola gregarius]